MAFKDFIILLAKALGITLIIGSLTIIVFRAIWIKWNRTGKFIMKYKIFKSKVDPVRAEWIMEALKKGLNIFQIKMKLLLAGFKDEDVHEMVYLAKQFSKQMKGGNKANGRRRFENSNSKNESRNLPNISSY